MMRTVPNDDTQKPESFRPDRLTSIDALRGFDMFWIVGGDDIARALAKWWGTPRSQTLAEQFEHVAWEGFRFYDLIFPLFLFTVGVVLPFSLRRYQSGDQPKAAAFGRLVRRAVLLFLLGLIYNNLLRFDFANLRVTGVLQRIAICYGIAAVIFLLTKARTQAILLVAILVGYWAILMYVPSPESQKAGDLSIETNLAGYLDRHFLPGKIYKSYYGFGDNEGLLSTLPAVATTLLGVLAGHWLLSDRNRWIKALGLALAGGACLGLGFLWSQEFPIIKILWTSSYVLVAGGFSLLLLSLFYTIIDVIENRWSVPLGLAFAGLTCLGLGLLWSQAFPTLKFSWFTWISSYDVIACGCSLFGLALIYTIIDAIKPRAWAFCFVVIGVNAITIYMAARIIPFDDIARFFLGGVARHSGSFGPVVVPIGTLVIEWLFLLHLYRNKIFLRV
jgi:predicted acyltransferase